MTMWHYRPAAAPAAAAAAAPNADDSEEDDEDDVADIVPMAKPTGSLSDYFFLTIYSRPLSYFFSFTPSPFSPCPWGHHPIFIIYYYSFSYSVVPSLIFVLSRNSFPVPLFRPFSGPKPRRTSVSAESMDPSKMNAMKENVTSIEKSPEVTERLLAVVGKSPLLRTLDNDQKDMIVKAFSGPVQKPPGENVIVQGDIGDIFYLLEEGSVDVYIKKKGEETETKVHTYKPGDAFGELAIMYNAPRAATCRASTDCKLWALVCI